MSTPEIISKIESLKEWKALQQEAAALKQENNALYLRYLKQTTSRRFSIS